MEDSARELSDHKSQPRLTKMYLAAKIEDARRVLGHRRSIANREQAFTGCLFAE
jgi:hypothetical protein